MSECVFNTHHMTIDLSQVNIIDVTRQLRIRMLLPIFHQYNLITSYKSWKHSFKPTKFVLHFLTFL